MLLGSSWTGAQPPVETSGDLAWGTVGTTSSLRLHQDHSGEIIFKIMEIRMFYFFCLRPIRECCLLSVLHLNVLVQDSGVGVFRDYNKH